MTREEAIAFFEDMNECTYGNLEAVEMAIEALKQQRWIPVSERPPKEDGDYIVTTRWKGSFSGDVYIETNMAVYREQKKEWDCVDVIAWMPSPEP